MSHFDSLDIELQFLSTKSNSNHEEEFLNESFEEDQNKYINKDEDFVTQLNKVFYIPNSPNSEILKSENVNIVQKNAHNIPLNNMTPKNCYILRR